MNFSSSLNIRGHLLDLSSPKLMGIINVTPDSFFEGNRHQSVNEILLVAEKMLTEGASFIDIGGYSSRPGALDISVEEELKRTIPPIVAIRERFPELIISIDTFRSRVAQEAIIHGASMVNDISGGDLDQKMVDVISNYKVPYVVMHMKGTPQDMNAHAKYDDLMKEIIQSLSEKVNQLEERGIHDLIVDPGFGFAKTIDQNFELLSNLDLLKVLDRPILVGLSRKSMIYKTLDISPSETLNGTTVVNTLALLKGASILRVHDVKEAAEVVKLVENLSH